MSGININGRERSMIFYADQMDDDMWETFCKQAGKDPKRYQWLRVNFDVSDVDDSDDDLENDDIVQYKIYQLRNMRETSYGFMPWEFAKDQRFTINDYYMVYSGYVYGKDALDTLFEMFNVNRPADFRGHSLSVSDVVAISETTGDEWNWYYCDSFGWKNVTDIIKEEEL